MQRKRSMVGEARRGVLTLLALGLGLIGLMATPSPGWSQNSAYTVRDIAVSISGQSGDQARTLGMAEARQAAFTHLFQQLTPRTYHRSIPSLSQQQLGDLIQSVDVQQEQITSTNYNAELTMEFDSAKVRSLLTSMRIPYTDRVSPPLLIVPVYEWAGAQQLWEVPNPWHTAWSEQVGKTGLLTTGMAKGDAREQLILSADQAVSGDSASLQQWAQAYRAGGAVVALGQLRVDPASGRPVLDVKLQGYGAAPAGPISQRFEGSAGSRAGLAAEQLTRTAAAAMADALVDAWKSENLKRTDLNSNSLTVSVPLSYIGDYATALRLIGEVNSLESAVVTRVSATEAQFELRYRSDLEQVRRAFSQFGMQLDEQAGGWVLRING